MSKKKKVNLLPLKNNINQLLKKIKVSSVVEKKEAKLINIKK